MPAATRGGFMFDLGTVVHSALDDAGWLGIRIDGFGDEESGLGDSELQTPFGFTSRPVDRDDNGGCDVLYAHAGNSESFAWIGTDRRYSAKCPPLYQGSSAHWSSTGQFLLLDTEKHTATLYVPRGSVAHVVTVGEDSAGKPTIALQHSNASYITLNDDGVTVRGVGNAFINVNGTKVALNGEVTTTASMTVGGVAAQPVPNSTAFAAGIASIASPITAKAGAPVTSAELGAALVAIAALLSPAGGCSTQMFKAV
jgi:hypothetical protein